LMGSATVAEKNDAIGKPISEVLAPYSFVFSDMDGNEVRLEDIHDRTIFLNFWGTYCKPCISELQSINECRRMLGDTEIEFILVSEERKDKIKAFKKKNPQYNSFTYLQSPDLYYDYGVEAIPHTYIVQHGFVVTTFRGTYDWTAQDKVAILKAFAKQL